MTSPSAPKANEQKTFSNARRRPGKGGMKMNGRKKNGEKKRHYLPLKRRKLLASEAD